MKRRQVIFAGLAVAAIGAAAGWGATRRAGSAAPAGASAADGATSGPSAVGDVPQALWALSLPGPDGAVQALAQWRGQPTVVNFWATWCAPCVKEMPDLDALAKKHPGVKFVGIGIDSAANIRAFTAKIPVAYPLLVFEAGGVDMLRRLGNLQGGLPFTLVLDAQGRIAHRVLGQLDPQDLDRRLSG